MDTYRMGIEHRKRCGPNRLPPDKSHRTPTRWTSCIRTGRISRDETAFPLAWAMYVMMQDIADNPSSGIFSHSQSRKHIGMENRHEGESGEPSGDMRPSGHQSSSRSTNGSVTSIGLHISPRARNATTDRYRPMPGLRTYPQIGTHRQQPEQGAQHILPFRDPRHRLHVQRMHREKGRNESALPQPPVIRHRTRNSSAVFARWNSTFTR